MRTKNLRAVFQNLQQQGEGKVVPAMTERYQDSAPSSTAARPRQTELQALFRRLENAPHKR